MEKLNKKIIKAFAQQGFDEVKPFGQSVAHILFARGERALLHINGHYSILLQKDADATKELRTLAELLSYLRYMEQEHIVYVQYGETQSNDFVFYSGCYDMKKSSAIQGYELGDGVILKETTGTYQIIANGNTTVLSQEVNIDFITEEVEKYLCGRLLPTAVLQSFINHGFLSENDYNNHQALRISRRSILVALIIASLSPIATLWMTNKWGISTIEETQYSTIIEKIEGKQKVVPVETIKPELTDSTTQKCQKNE